jgi:hypothetical protein
VDGPERILQERCRPRDTATVDATGSLFTPGATVALWVGLAGLRSELAEAQRQDKRLNDIIRYLQKESAGSYLSEPRVGELRRTQARAFKYRLTSDNLFVARRDGDDGGEDLPVAPQAPRISEIKGPPRI